MTWMTIFTGTVLGANLLIVAVFWAVAGEARRDRLAARRRRFVGPLARTSP